MKPLPMHIETRAKSRIEIESADNVDVKQEVTKSTVWVVAAAPVLIGLWAAACIIAGLLASEGPVAFVQKWMSAIISM
jgi:lipopolysaccharide/colanic/teichoic acid biosynthesis glycosyltransferase